MKCKMTNVMSASISAEIPHCEATRLEMNLLLFTAVALALSQHRRIGGITRGQRYEDTCCCSFPREPDCRLELCQCDAAGLHGRGDPRRRDSGCRRLRPRIPSRPLRRMPSQSWRGRRRPGRPCRGGTPGGCRSPLPSGDVLALVDAAARSDCFYRCLVSIDVLQLQSPAHSRGFFYEDAISPDTRGRSTSFVSPLTERSGSAPGPGVVSARRHRRAPSSLPASGSTLASRPKLMPQRASMARIGTWSRR